MGVGILYGKEEILENATFHGGGEDCNLCFEKTITLVCPLNWKQEHQMLGKYRFRAG